PTVVWTDYSHLYERAARRRLAAQVDKIEAAGGSVAGQHLLHGPAIDALLDLCEELHPGLLVTGSRGLGAVRRVGLGSVSEGVVHHAHCPVLVVRGGGDAWPPEKVVIGDDGSEGAWAVAKLAAGIATACEAGVALVRAYRNPPEPIGGWSAGDRRMLDRMRSVEWEALGERAEMLRAVSESQPTTKLVEGDAAHRLLVAGGGDDGRNVLLAVGSRGIGPLRRMRLGSVSTSVLRGAEGTVLVCPPSARDAVPAGHATASEGVVQ
ncbi:MAG TPA: universal stress protein, partial [Rubrobacter sp.]|nr:universal stress protein [Rubrobacter sp.]